MSKLDEIEARLRDAGRSAVGWLELRDHAVSDLEALIVALRKVEELHKPGPESADGVVCFECAPALWPCPTATAVQGLEAST